MIAKHDLRQEEERHRAQSQRSSGISGPRPPIRGYLPSIREGQVPDAVEQGHADGDVVVYGLPKSQERKRLRLEELQKSEGPSLVTVLLFVLQTALHWAISTYWKS